MNDIQIFKHEQFGQIRTVEQEDKVYGQFHSNGSCKYGYEEWEHTKHHKNQGKYDPKNGIFNLQFGLPDSF